MSEKKEATRAGISVQTSVGATTTGGPGSSEMAGDRPPVAGNTMTKLQTTTANEKDERKHNQTRIFVETSVGTTTTGGPGSSDVAGNRSPVAGNTTTNIGKNNTNETTASCSTAARNKLLLRRRNGSDKKWLRKCRATGMSEEVISNLLLERLRVPLREPLHSSRQPAHLDKEDKGDKGGTADKARRPMEGKAPETSGKARTMAKAKAEPVTGKEGAKKKPETADTGKVVPSTKKAVEGGKRNRSEDINPPKPKKRKTGKSPTFSEVVCESLKVAIVDNSHSEGKIVEPTNQEVLTTRFEEWQVEALRGDSDFVPRFHWSGFFNGHFRATCADMSTLEFLKRKVTLNRQLWDGANLEVVGKDDVPKLKKISVWLPREFREAREVLSFMDRLNWEMKLGTSEWKILTREVRKGIGQWLLLGVQETVVKTLEKVGGKVYYLNRKVRFVLPRAGTTGSEGKPKKSETERVEPQPSTSSAAREEDLESLYDKVADMDVESDMESIGSLYSFGDMEELQEVLPGEDMSDILQEMEDMDRTVIANNRGKRTPSHEEILAIIGVDESKTSTPEKKRSTS